MDIELPQGRRMDVEQEGDGPHLVLLHSLLTDRSAFDRVRPALARQHRLTVPNLPGYGASSPGGDSIEDYADRVAELLAALQLPPDTAVLGNGLGGFTGVALAIRHGARFGRLIVVDALAGFPEAGKAPLRALASAVVERGMGAALDAAILRMFPPAYIQAHPEVVEERKQALRRMDPAIFSKLCLALTRAEFAAVLPRIRNRTLVLVGAQDAATPPALARQLAAGIPGAAFEEIPGCGHCPQIEQPDLFVARVTEFLGKR